MDYWVAIVGAWAVGVLVGLGIAVMISGGKL